MSLKIKKKMFIKTKFINILHNPIAVALDRHDVTPLVTSSLFYCTILYDNLSKVDNKNALVVFRTHYYLCVYDDVVVISSLVHLIKESAFVRVEVSLQKCTYFAFFKQKWMCVSKQKSCKGKHLSNQYLPFFDLYVDV